MMFCQKCRTPLKLDGSLDDLNPAAYDLLVSEFFPPVIPIDGQHSHTKANFGPEAQELTIIQPPPRSSKPTRMRPRYHRQTLRMSTIRTGRPHTKVQSRMPSARLPSRGAATLLAYAGIRPCATAPCPLSCWRSLKLHHRDTELPGARRDQPHQTHQRAQLQLRLPMMIVPTRPTAC